MGIVIPLDSSTLISAESGVGWLMARRLARSIWYGGPAAEVSRLEALGAAGWIARQIEDWSSARPAEAPDRLGPGPGPAPCRADVGAQALDTTAAVRLLPHNAVRVGEARTADIADLGEDCGHRVIRVVRKGARKAKIPLTAATVAALDALPGRPGSQRRSARLTAAGGVLAGNRRRAVPPGSALGAGALPGPHCRIGAREQISPHCPRHSAITFALDAGASLRDVQDYAGHKDPRTTRRYDHSRDSLDRNAAYTVPVCLE